MDDLIKVRVFDHEYVIKSDEDKLEVHEIARFVDNKMREIKSNTQGLSEKNIAILAAFDIASEYFQARRERADLAMDMQKRAEALNCQIDSVVDDLKGDGANKHKGVITLTQSV